MGICVLEDIISDEFKPLKFSLKLLDFVVPEAKGRFQAFDLVLLPFQLVAEYFRLVAHHGVMSLFCFD